MQAIFAASASWEGWTFWRRPLTWLLVCLGVGLALRGYHYGRNPVVWHDEAALLLNATDKTFAEQLGPLFFAEAAPPLFLWLERVVSLALGTSSWALRMVPFLASAAALVLLSRLAWRVLPPWPAAACALLFACSDRLLWHASEAKPYATDVFVAALVLYLFAKRDAAKSTARTCLMFAVLSPFLVFLSFPACFVLGGVALALLPAMWRERRPGSLLWYGLFSIVLVGSFLALLAGPIAAQRVPQLEADWCRYFPHWDQPWLLPLEMLQRFSEAGRYACEPVGNVLAALAVLGGVMLWQAGRRRLMVAAATPLVLLMAAWLAGKYPVGPLRLVVFAAPAVLFLASAGLPVAWAWLRARHRCAPALLLVLLLIPLAQAVYRSVVLWDHAEADLAIAHLRHQLRPGELVIGTGWDHTWYCRDLGDAYRTLIAWPHDPELPGPLRAGEPLGATCWLLLREDLEAGDCPILLRSPTVQEQVAVRELAIGTQWQVLSEHSFRGVSVLHLQRSDDR